MAANLEHLAERYARDGRLFEAESLYQKVMATTNFGPGHNLLAGAALNNLGLVRNAQGRQDEAASLIQQSLTFWLRVPEAGDPYVAATLNNLATVYREMGRYQEAESLYRRALAIEGQPGNTGKPYTPLILSNLAELHKKQE